MNEKKQKDLGEIISTFFESSIRDLIKVVFCILVLVGLFANVIVTVSLKIDIQELRKTIINNQK